MSNKLPEPFIVRHYISDGSPSIKGNGFDGLLIGEDRVEAQAFVDYVNTQINAAARRETELQARVGQLEAEIAALKAAKPPRLSPEEIADLAAAIMNQPLPESLIGEVYPLKLKLPS